ncbi:alpha/beta hydrolase [Bordetella avium]|uniref:alpha/beta hydrolase n=1 Tax=Bordetella avium TaxID=521 RepID=UPI000E0AC175|nr:alpha/beta hydrolase [Bordetella avium]RIQ11426.1 alpha/beta hydrolase [Bordetella avium]RIQ34820.1 alpha/beta hydrolase [Bordetella avium]RIQ38217.1 alpha/beta hydrolase [Bordetella avium]RIQ39249.1 alpha/beta hydrolase [Bordetella avium]RIQ44873.1 alpha/beta hydrolase [Bordetella avium]
MLPMTLSAGIDLFFASLAEREVEYNARASVPDFDACVRRYAQSAAAIRASRPGIIDLRYGMGADERLDLFPPAAAATPAPLFVFIHGGYWRAQRKEDAPIMAGVLNAAGAAVATLEYTLMPEATMGEVVREMRSGLAWLYRNAAAYGLDPERIYIGGSSVGGQLVGMLLAPDWPARYGVPDNIIKGALALSGLFDLRPLCDISVNQWLRLTPEQAARHSPMFNLPQQSCPLLLSVGGLETRGFKNQTAAFEAAWRERGLSCEHIAAPHCNHFDLLCELELPASPMTQALLNMMGLQAD